MGGCFDDGRSEVVTAVRTVADIGVMAGADGLESGGGSDASGLIVSRLETVLLQYDIDTVVLAFHQPNRAEFFGALDVCHKHGIDVKIHREYADAVLVAEDDVEGIVDVDLEPWDPLDHLFKRCSTSRSGPWG